MLRQCGQRSGDIHGGPSGFVQAGCVRFRSGSAVLGPARCEEDALAFQQDSPIIPACPLDLSKLPKVVAPAQRVETSLAQKGFLGFYGLENNAGGETIAPLEQMNVPLDCRQLLGAPRITGVPNIASRTNQDGGGGLGRGKTLRSRGKNGRRKARRGRSRRRIKNCANWLNSIASGATPNRGLVRCTRH